jgi:hypothetical protein
LLGTAIAGEHESYWLDRARVDVDLDKLERLSAGIAEIRLRALDALPLELGLRIAVGRAVVDDHDLVQRAAFAPGASRPQRPPRRVFGTRR